VLAADEQLVVLQISLLVHAHLLEIRRSKLALARPPDLVAFKCGIKAETGLIV
jgi:hypothetical protein